MSSTTDNVICPVCGGNALRDQDNRTCDVYIHCTDCGWNSESGYKDPDKIYIGWSWKDIESLKPDWNEDKCQEALESISGQLQDQLVEEGWNVMEVLLNIYEDGKK